MKSLREIMKEYSKECISRGPDCWSPAEVDELEHRFKLELLEDIKFGFDLCSDTSAFCLGYRNLVRQIEREKENKPIDKSISPIKPYKND